MNRLLRWTEMLAYAAILCAMLAMFYRELFP